MNAPVIPSPIPEETAGRQLSTVERAYQLARSGACRNLAEITLQLRREKHDAVEAHLAGQSIRRDLRRLCSETAKAAGR